VVHSLIKNENQQTASVDLSQELLDINEISVELVQRLDASYRKSEITNAIFDDTSGNVFPKEFKKYLSQKRNDDFLFFTSETTNNLKDQVQNIAPAKGGFLVFAEYSVDARNYISVFLIRDTIGMLFSKDNRKGSYIINPAEHLDLDKLAMACKMDLLKYETNGGKYLGFIKRKMETISKYFINWISVKERESNAIFTDSLYELISQIDLPLDENQKEIPRDEFMAKVFDYVKSAPSGTININDLSKFFYTHETHMVDFAEKNNFVIDTVFQPDGRVMRKFIRIDVDSDGIHIRFSRGELQKKIRFDPSNKNIVIIESKKFADDLRKATA
jgi:nucleoid-associated protein